MPIPNLYKNIPKPWICFAFTLLTELLKIAAAVVGLQAQLSLFLQLGNNRREESALSINWHTGRLTVNLFPDWYLVAELFLRCTRIQCHFSTTFRFLSCTAKQPLHTHFVFFLLTMWLFITKRDKLCMKKGCRQQNKRLMNKHKHKSLGNPLHTWTKNERE